MNAGKLITYEVTGQEIRLHFEKLEAKITVLTPTIIRVFGKLDEIIQRLYEDNLEGKISDERFVKMTASYEAEQHTLEQRVAELRTAIAAEKETALNADHFLTLVRKYTEIPELTAEIIREFVEKVYVYQSERVDGKKVQRIKIIYNCIGDFQTPPTEHEKTA